MKCTFQFSGNFVRRHSLAAATAATASCDGSACGDEVPADGAECDDVLDWTDGVDIVGEMAQLVTDEFWETFSVMHGRAVAATTELRDRADEAEQGTTWTTL